MNAVSTFTKKLSRRSLARILSIDDTELVGRRTAAVRRDVERRFQLDLVGFLNGLRKQELEKLEPELDTRGSVGRLRFSLWRWAAQNEAGTEEYLGTILQPEPAVIAGRLVKVEPPRGEYPSAVAWPRPLPPVVGPPEIGGEPETKEELLERADRLVGVCLGGKRVDKGAFGNSVAAFLGLKEGCVPEPDWQGEIEVKTLPVVRDGNGFWRVKEDPAISTDGVRPLAKLQKVLWIARAADDNASPVLSWYYQESDEWLTSLYEKHLHQRPKGPKGTNRKGWYLQKRFFAESGFLCTLNG